MSLQRARAREARGLGGFTSGARGTSRLDDRPTSPGESGANPRYPGAFCWSILRRMEDRAPKPLTTLDARVATASVLQTDVPLAFYHAIPWIVLRTFCSCKLTSSSPQPNSGCAFEIRILQLACLLPTLHGRSPFALLDSHSGPLPPSESLGHLVVQSSLLACGLLLTKKAPNVI